MEEIYEYCIQDQDNTNFNIKCRIKSNTENSYDTTYYFFDGERWLKDFIDLSKIEPSKKEDKNNFEEFITRIHDYMVHGNLWDDIKEIKDETKTNDKYNLIIKSDKIE